MRSFSCRLLALLGIVPACLLCQKATAQAESAAATVLNPTAALSSVGFPDAREFVRESRDNVRTVTSSTASNSKMLSFTWPVSRRRSVAVSMEYMKVASFYYKMPGQSEKPDWYFKSIPLTFSLEQVAGNPDWRIAPVAGVGASVYLSKTRTRLNENPSEFDSQIGAGVGVQANLGLKTRITSSTFFLSQARYRIIDGLALSGHDANYSFGMLDFAVGFGIDF